MAARWANHDSVVQRQRVEDGNGKNKAERKAMSIPRLSPYNIENDLVRGRLYREIREGQSGDEWLSYEVQPADELFPELIAYKVYGPQELKWLILVAASLDDMRERIDAGTVLRLPSIVWVRQRIKYYSEL